MTILTLKQVAQYAKGAGFTGQNLVKAVAISCAEDGSHDTNALGDVALETSTWGPSVGLWQIRSLKSEYGTGQDRDQLALYNPAFNAKAAYTLSGGGNFSPWSTYTSGAYQQYMTAAQNAVNSLSSITVTIPVPAPVQPVVTSVENHPMYYLIGLCLVGVAGYYAYRVIKTRGED